MVWKAKCQPIWANTGIDQQPGHFSRLCFEEHWGANHIHPIRLTLRSSAWHWGPGQGMAGHGRAWAIINTSNGPRHLSSSQSQRASKSLGCRPQSQPGIHFASAMSVKMRTTNHKGLSRQRCTMTGTVERILRSGIFDMTASDTSTITFLATECGLHWTINDEPHEAIIGSSIRNHP